MTIGARSGGGSAGNAPQAGFEMSAGIWITSWPLKDQSADQIKAEDVFKHAADPIALMLQCWRILRPEGHLRLRTSY